MRCRVCNNNLKNSEYQVKEMLVGTRNVFQYFKCSCCGCLQIGEIPEDIEQYYQNNYYSYREPAYSKKKVVKNITNVYLKTLLKFGVSFLGPLDEVLPECRVFKALSRASVTKKSRILDVGCGSGSALWFLQEFGFTNLLGIDPFIQKDVFYPNGLIIKKQEVLAMEGEWDVIMFNHSFEHIHNPLETFQKVSSSLSDKGVCIIRIPVADSYAWRKHGVNWINLDAPRHFYLHTVKSLQHLAAEAGLFMRPVHYDSDTSSFWGSRSYKNNIAMYERKTGRLRNLLNIFYYTPFVMWLNAKKQGDWAVFYLSKKNS